MNQSRFTEQQFVCSRIGLHDNLNLVQANIDVPAAEACGRPALLIVHSVTCCARVQSTLYMHQKIEVCSSSGISIDKIVSSHKQSKCVSDRKKGCFKPRFELYRVFMYMLKLHFFLKKRISIRNSEYDKNLQTWD